VPRGDKPATIPFDENLRKETFTWLTQCAVGIFIASDFPFNVRKGYLLCEKSNVCAERLERAVFEHSRMQDGMVSLDFIAALPVPAIDVDEIRIFGKQCGASFHVVPVPRFLPSRFDAANEFFIVDGRGKGVAKE
jgi:hypothetical protein